MYRFVGVSWNRFKHQQQKFREPKFKRTHPGEEELHRVNFRSHFGSNNEKILLKAKTAIKKE